MTPATASTLQRDVDAVVSAPPTPPVGTLPSTHWINERPTRRAPQATGRLSDERAAQIRAVRQWVLEDLHRIHLSSPTPGPTTSTQTTPSTETNDNGGNGGGNDGQSGKSKGDGEAKRRGQA
jgi:hypothetical protein